MRLGIQVTLISLILGVLVFAPAGYINHLQQEQDEEAYVKSEMQKIGQRYADEAQLHLNNGMQIAKLLKDLFLAVRNDKEGSRSDVLRLLGRIMEGKPDYFGAWSVWEPNAFDDQDSLYIDEWPHGENGRLAFYWHRASYDLHVMPLSEYDTPGKGDYYQIPKAEHQAVVLPPYSYTIEGQKVHLISFIIPIIENGVFLGVVGVDIDLERLSRRMESFVPIGADFSALFSEKGLVVLHREHFMIGRKIKDISYRFDSTHVEALERCISKFRPFYDQKYNKGRESTQLVLSMPIPIMYTGKSWSYVFVIPAKRIKSTFKRHKEMAFYILPLAVLIYVLILRYLINRFISPLHMACRFVEAIGKGNYSLQLPTKKLNGKNELACLMKSLQAMQHNILDRQLSRQQKTTHEQWLNQISQSLHEAMQGNLTTEQLSQNILNTLAAYVEVVTALFYIYKSEEKSYYCSAVYAHLQHEHFRSVFKAGEGLTGLVAETQKPIIINDLPPTYINAQGSAIEALPETLLILPLVYQNTSLAVMEFGLQGHGGQNLLEIWEAMEQNMSIACYTVISQQRMKELLGTSSVQEAKMKEALVHLEQLQAESENKQDHFNSVLSAIDQIVTRVEYNIDGIITDVNDNYLAAMSCRREDLIGRHFNMLTSGEESNQLNRLWAKLCCGQSYQGHLSCKNSLGERQYLNISLSPMKDKHGEINKILYLATETPCSQVYGQHQQKNR